MDDYRSNSNVDGRMQMERYYEPQFAASYNGVPPQQNKELKLRKGKSTGGSTSKSWNLNDPEFQRKRRVASYKVYSVEGKVKGSLRRSFRWFKHKYTRVVYGW